jgi:hypothetical protein
VTGRGRVLLATGLLLAVSGGALGLWALTRPPRWRRWTPDPSPADAALAERARDARARGDAADAAEANALLGARALAAAERTARAWIGARDVRLGLFARKLDDPAHLLWNYKDVAADCYAHVVNAALLLAPDLVPAARDMLEAERRLAPDLPLAVRLDTGLPVEAESGLEARAFGAVEYAKDGLLSVLELHGETPWLGRLEEVVGQVYAKAALATRGGTVVSAGSEKNGEMLQVLARLWHRTRDEETLRRGRGIAGAYVREVFPVTGGLPVMRFDFAEGKAVEPRVALRDHGNETIAGLVEWSIVERTAKDGRPGDVVPAVEAMLDRLLEVGRTPQGFWRNSAAPTPEAARRDTGNALNDNWGYLCCAYVAYARTLDAGDPRRSRYEAAVRDAMRAVAGTRGANWEGGRFDGFADSLEGMIYLLRAFDDADAAAWVDDEAMRLLAYQRADGFVRRQYLDGNFVRTCLLYGLWKSAGARPVPWRADVSVGAHRAEDGLHVVVRADRAWKGTVVFDGPRHRETLRLPTDYPRLNEWPEWFAVDPTASHEVVDAASGASRTVTGAAMRAGLPVEVGDGGAVRWIVR